MPSMRDRDASSQTNASRPPHDRKPATGEPLVVGITGASGGVYGVRLLEVLGELGIATHLVMTDWGAKTLRMETPRTLAEVRALASWTHSVGNQAAAIASGSHLTRGMAIVPCSVNTLAALAHGRADNLLLRAADVTLKERRPLVAVVRETPLSHTHIRNMLACSEAGITIMPPMPAYYDEPQSLEDHIDQFTGRLLDQFGIPHRLGHRWRAERSCTDHSSAGSSSAGSTSAGSKRSSDPSSAPASREQASREASISTL